MAPIVSNQRKFLHRPAILAFAILGLSFSLAAVETPAQEAAPAALNPAAQSSSFEGARVGTAPYLVLGMVEPGQAPSYTSLTLPRNETASRSSRDTWLQPITRVSSPDQAEKDESARLLLTSLFPRSNEVRNMTNFHEERATQGQTIRPLSDAASIETYTLLAGTSVAESFLYGYPPNNFPSKQWSSDNASTPHQEVQPDRALVQLELGGWHLPVMLSRSGVSR